MSAHQAMYPIRTMARVLEGFDLGLLRLADPTRFGSGDRRRRSDASYPHDPRWIAWNLWRAACSRRAEGRRPLCWPERICPANASRRDRRRQPAQKRADHDPTGDRPSSRQRSRPPQLRGRAAERIVGGRHHLPADVGRISLSCGRPRRLVATDRRMGLLGRSEGPCHVADESARWPAALEISSGRDCLAPRAHRRSAESAMRWSGSEVALDVEGVEDGSVSGEKSR